MLIILGAGSRPGKLKNLEGQLIPIKRKRKSGYIFWKRFSSKDKSGVICVAMPLETPGKILKEFLKKPGVEDFRLTYWDHEFKEASFSQNDETYARIARKMLELNTDGFISFGYRRWAILKTSFGVFIGSVPIFSSGFQSTRGMINLCFLILFAILLSLLLNPNFSFEKYYLRISTKFSAVFLVAVALPVSALVLSGIMAISDHEKVLFADVKKEQIKLLSSIEDEFVNEKFLFEKSCQKIAKQVLENYSLSEIEKEFKKLVDSRKAVRAEMRGLNGNALLIKNFGSTIEGLEKTIDAFSRHLIREQLKERLENEKVVLNKPPDQVFTNMFTSADFGFAQISAAPDKIHIIDLDQKELYQYWSYIRKPDHPAAILSFFLPRETALKNFVKRTLKKLSSINFVFGAYDCNLKLWLDNGYKGNNELNEMVDEAKITGNAISRRLQIGENSFIAIVYPGRILKPFCLVRLVDFAPIASNLFKLKLSLVAGILLILIVSFAIAQLLAKTFLKPIEEFDQGMKKLQSGSPDAKVSLISHDEFGELGKAFNQMVDDLSEMRLAKVVQDSLFPQKKIHIKGFDTAIFNETASDLGGDYCDILPYSEGKWLLVIGDVSGHGTPAALAMAMVKAAIFKGCRDKIPFSNLASSLSKMLLKTLKRKKMMTMLFLLLDPIKKSIQIMNAGHNWPLVIHKNGQVEELKVQGMPLGVKESKRVRELIEIDLSHGETLFCYTDALIEGQSPREEMFGHDRVYRELENKNKLSPDELISYIQFLWKQFLEGEPQEDDLTMLAVKSINPEASE